MNLAQIAKRAYVERVFRPPSFDKWLRRNWLELLIETLIRIAGISIIFIVGLIFLFLVREGLPTFLDIPLRQLFGSRWYPTEGYYGLWPLIVGSFLVTVGAVVIAVPLGVTAVAA
jgi:phosphate transport system permease protein